jgi:F-type H+-transporting ATPase subunit gamma
METLERLRTRIGTITTLGDIVRTMKTLSAVSIRQYERAAEALGEHRETIELGLQVALRDAHVQAAALRLAPRTLHGARAAIIVFGSDRGLCGRFNEFVAELAGRRIRRLRDVGAAPLVLAVGARAASALEAQGHAPEEIFFLPGSVDGLARTAQAILVKTDEWRAEHGVARLAVCANRRGERVPAQAWLRQILPFEADTLHALSHRPWGSHRLPESTVEPGDLFSRLVRQYLFVEIFSAGAESLASEHAARLMAMQAAERHITEHLDEMRGSYRRARQSAITSELLDVVGGFEAVRHGLQAAAEREGGAERP